MVGRQLHTGSDEMFMDIVALMDLIPVGIRCANRHGICEYVNQTFIEMFGYPLSEISSVDDWFTRAYPDPAYRNEIIAWYSEKIPRLIRGATPPPLTVRITCQDGAEKHVIVTAHSVMGRIICIYTDITEQAKATELQLEVEKMFRLAFEGARDAIFWANTETGILVNCNRAAEELIEAPRNEIIGRHFTFLHPADTEETATAQFEKVSTLPETQEEIDAVVITRSGKRIPVLIRNSITQIGDTAVVQGIFLDISHRKLTEEALRKSEERYRAMVDAFDGFMYICSKERRIEFMNRRMIERIGYDASGDLCHKVLHNFESVCPWCVNARVFKGETVQWDFQSPKDGRWYHISNNPIENPEGILSKQVTIIDITERKQAEQDRVALEAQKMMVEEQRQFLGLVSHEIRTPLAVIDGAAQLITLGSRRSSPWHAQAVRIRGAATRLIDLIDSCLTDERLSTGGWQPDMRSNDIRMIVRTAAEQVQAGTRIHVVATDLSQLPEMFTCDSMLVKVMIGNLLDNAVKYSPKGGTIYLRGYARDNGNSGICLEVSDEGIGIPPYQSERIFKRFYRTWQISGVAGAGLGLHLVRKIAELHGGGVTCRSTLGSGSTFTVVMGNR